MGRVRSLIFFYLIPSQGAFGPEKRVRYFFYIEGPPVLLALPSSFTYLNQVPCPD